MSLFIKSSIFISSFLLLSGCDFQNRREFCDCMNLGQALEDSFTLSKKEQEEKAKGCEWINEELSAQELLEEISKCK